jgi:hypothetical protein
MRRASHVFNRLYANEVYGKAGNDIEIVPAASGITIIGDAGAPTRLGTPTNDDIFINGRMELGGIGQFNSNVYMNSSTSLYIGNSSASTRFFNDAGVLNLRHEINKTGNVFNFRNGAGLGMTASSGTQYMMGINPRIDQSGTASYVALSIDATENATGSGTKDLIKAHTGSALKFNVDNAGQCVQGAPTTAATLLNAQVSLHLDEAGENLVFDIKESDGTAETVTIAYDP